MYITKVRGVLVEGNKTYGQITKDITAPLYARTPIWWYVAATIAFAAMTFGGWAVYTTVSTGIGTWGVNNNVAWGWGIINFVWWIGIGHAGTAFSIFLLILRQRWRTSINRAAEAMTVVAVICAGMFPMLHMGRIWNAFFILPYWNTRGPLWVNFNSPLFWDVVAISTYFMASAVFWYIGMIPDFATIRDTTASKVKRKVYGFFSFGWVGSAKGWLRFETASLLLGGLAAPLVVAVHSIVSMDFATSVMPGWHTTIFPPYFVIGAIFSGFGMVLTLMIIVRKVFKFQEYVTKGHLDAIARILTFISLVMATAYTTEFFIAWYGGQEYEMFTFMKNRVTGDYTLAFWTMVTCNAIIPQLFWSKKIRKNITIVFIISIFINIGMWFERYVIVVTSLSKDFLPSSWASYQPTIVEMGIFIGTLGIFLFGVLLFFRYIPMIAISEVKGILKKTSKKTSMIRTNIIGVYDDEEQIVKAIHHIQDKDIKIKDVFTPIPIHGVFEALNLKTRLPLATFLYGALGTSVTFAFLYWTSVVSYPLKFGGKPLNSLSFIIIMFVATILIATFLTFMTFFIRQKLFPGKKVQMLDTRSTDDKFIIVVERAEDISAAELKKIKSAMKESGASEINEVEEEIIEKEQS